MRKHFKFLSLLLVLPLLGGCGHEHTFATEWSFNESTHYHAATCGHDVKADEAPHSYIYGICTVCSYRDPNRATWNNEQKQIFIDHLYGYELPYINGLDVKWDETISSVVVSGTGISKNAFTNYLTLMVSQGFSKQDGPIDDGYILLKEINVNGKIKTIDIDIFLSESNLYAICYDPFTYEWPTDIVNDLYDNYFYIAPTVRIPSIDADKYFVNTSYMASQAMLQIDCYSNTNLVNTYKQALTQKGFSIKESEYIQGAYIAYDPQEISEVTFLYSNENKIFSIVLAESNKSWPSFVVDYYTDQLTNSSGTRVPALTGADTYEFIDVYDRYGYFFVLCECQNDLTTSYETSLDEHYTLYNEKKNTAGNYWAISDKNDLLVQYIYCVTESPFGGKDYKHFDVLFEKYFPLNEEHIKAGLELIQPGTKTTLPAYPGYGEKIDFSSTNKYMTVTIQAATYDSVATYVDTLLYEDWSVKEVSPTMYNYQAISNDRDIFMEISLVDGRVTLTLSAHEDPPAVWPTEGINEILTTLGIHGEVPVFDGAFGYDYENDTEHHDVICAVPYGKEQKLIDAYHKKLVDLGWRKIEVDDDNFYYVISGSTVGLTAYTEYAGEGKVFINIQYGDGDKYDVDARQAFIDWKISKDLDSSVLIPGINLSSKVVNSQLAGDDGVTYPGFSLFEILLDMGEADVDELTGEVFGQFVKDGWVYSSDDKYYHKSDCFMTSYEYLGYLAIDVCVPIPDRSLLGITESFISKLKEPYKNVVIPDTLVLTSEHSIELDTFNTGSWFDLYLFVDFNSASDCKTGMNEIVAAFKGVGWTEDEYSDIDDILLIDPTGKVRLELYRSNGSSSELHYEIDEAY